MKPAVVDVKPAESVRASADLVVAKYVAIGKALKSAKRDELWARFRLIRINEAIATPTSRQQTLVALASIERAISQ